MNDDVRLTEVVNKSGFPLQIGLAHLVNTVPTRNNWKALYSEHAWESEHDKEKSGFIDLVLERSTRDLILVVECKRARESDWVFLIPKAEKSDVKSRRQAKAWVTQYSAGNVESFDWKETTCDPASSQSEYCIIPKQDQGATPLLEKVGAQLVSSTEGLAWEEARQNIQTRSSLRVYFNVVVTTAKLKACIFDPALISVSDGTLKEPEYVDVPYIRFRKQLATAAKPSALTGTGMHNFARAKENTVFVVNANSFIQFLSEFDTDD